MANPALVPPIGLPWATCSFNNALSGVPFQKRT